MKTAALTLLAAAAIAALVATALVWSGVYNVAATTQHLQPVYMLLERTMHQSVRLRARGVSAPSDLDHNQARTTRGALCYRDKCERCHGAPGVAPEEMALSMQPLPGPLIDAPHKWSASELYWITRHGIKMSGMPAWQYRLPEADLWAVVAFVRGLPDLSARDYREVMAPLVQQRCETGTPAAEGAAEPPDAERGRQAFDQHGCNSCHVIPGVTGAQVHVGPPLAGMGRRQLIAGAVPNTPQQMVRWIREPHAVDPETAMPAMGVNEDVARDMAAYLASLR